MIKKYYCHSVYFPVPIADRITTLTLDYEVPEEYQAFFEDVTPRAFERIKELTEN